MIKRHTSSGILISIFLSIALFSGCSGDSTGDINSETGGRVPVIVSDTGGDIFAEEFSGEDTGYKGQYLGPDYFGGFAGDAEKKYQADMQAGDEAYGAPDSEDPGLSYKNFKSGALPGQTNSNSMYSLWKTEKMIANYFYSGNTEDEFGRYLSDSVKVYYYFDEDNAYMIFRFGSAGPFYINSRYSRLYSYNKITNEILMAGIAGGGFHAGGDSAVFSYFNLDDGKWHCHLLSKLKDITGEIKSVTDDEFKIKMWGYYAREELSLGDGSSKGSIDVTIDYKGKKIISERSPLVVLLKNAYDEKFSPVAGNAVTSKRDNRVSLKGIPDGEYTLYVIRINDILKNSDPEPGDIYTIYDKTFYGGPATAVIPVENGSYHNLLVDFNDSHALPAEIKGSAICGLSGVECSLKGSRLTVSVNINTDAFDSDPSISAYCYAPSACAYNHARFDNGQKMEISLVRKDNSAVWQGEAVLEDYNESGRWKIGMIQLRGEINGQSLHTGYSMADDERIQDSYTYYDWSSGESSVKLKTGVKVKSFDFRSKNSDITGPRLIGFDAVEKPGKKIEFSVTVENSGSSGHRLQEFSMDQFPVQIFLFHREIPPVNIDDTYALEFRDLPEIDGDYAVYRAELDMDNLSGYGDWDVKVIQLMDLAGNNSFYFIYNDDIYSGIFNFWGNDETYSLYCFGPDLPVQTELEMISVEKNPEPDIYISGYYNMDSKFSRFPDDEQIPCVWKNGVMKELAHSYKIFAYPASIFVKDKNIYIAGYAYSESDPMLRGRVADPVPCLWKDDKVIYLDENLYGRANSVFASENRIYAAGYYRNGKGRHVACFWIDNGTAVSRTDIVSGSIKEDCPTQATSVTVSSGIVYITGSYTDGAERFACLWKYNADGVKIESSKLGLEGFNDIQSNSVFLSDDNVYIAANYKNHEKVKTIASLWINNGQTIISEEPDVRVRSVFVAERTAYICGDYADSRTRRACIWEVNDSGIIQSRLYPQGSAYAYSVFASQNDIYLSGSHGKKNGTVIKNTACYWKNGTMTDLSGYGIHNAEAASIYILVK